MRKAWNKFQKRIDWKWIYLMLALSSTTAIVFHIFFSEDEWWMDMLIYMTVMIVLVVFPIGSSFIKFWTYLDVYGKEPKNL